MSKGVREMSVALKRVETALKEDYSLDDTEEYEAVRVLARACRRLLTLHGVMGSLILEAVTIEETT